MALKTFLRICLDLCTRCLGYFVFDVRDLRVKKKDILLEVLTSRTSLCIFVVKMYIKKALL